MGNAVVSGDQQVLWGEQSYAESLPLPHPTDHACTVTASCVQIFLNEFKGQNQKGEMKDVRALPSFLSVLEQEPSHPSSPGSLLHSQPGEGGEAGAVQSESRVLDEKQPEEEPAVRPGRVHSAPVLHMGQPATSQISDICVPHCPSIKWLLREWSEETLQPFCRAFAGEEEGSEMGVCVLKRMA